MNLVATVSESQNHRSILFPFLVKSLCNNKDIVKLVNKYGHSVSYDLLQEIEFALKVINSYAQRENRVVISQEPSLSGVALMVIDNTDNLQITYDRNLTEVFSNFFLNFSHVHKSLAVILEKL